MKKNLLIIFAKNPELGKVKTRIAAALGEEKALAIYYKLVNYTQQITTPLAVDKIVYYSNHIDREDNWSNTSFQKALQHGIDLGEKMANAFTESFTRGYSSVCIIGTDCLEITPDCITKAFDLLKENDVVLGPAKDGGYYLLGMNRMYPELFTNKHWSTNTVAKDTIQDIEKLQKSYALLKTLSDIDEEKDVSDWFNDHYHL